MAATLEPIRPTQEERKADRWLTFAGLMLILAGALDIWDAVWAFSAQDTTFDALFYDNNLVAWGWFYLVLGILLIATGFAVFARRAWAVFVGNGVALLATMVNFFWIFVTPLASIVLVTLNVLVVYALTMYGLGEDR
jgi:hypothetical protein